MPNENRDVEAVLTSAKSSRRLFWPGLTAVLIVVAAASLWFFWPWTSTTGGTQYLSQALDNGDITVTVTATGSVEPTNQVDISSELSGTVLSVEFDFNDTVRAGEILARLDTDKLEATVSHSRASLVAAEALVAEREITLEETKAAYERSVQLEERGITSTQTFLAAKAAYDRAKASLQSAAANVETAKADLKLNETNLDKACICSPINGVVLERNVEVGQIVAASFSAPVLFTLAEDLAKMQLQVDIDEADIGTVNEGNRAIFTVEAYQDKSFPATISELRYAPLTVSGVVTYKAILAIDNEELLLRPGMTATADIIVSEVSGVLRAPNAALRFTPPANLDEKKEGQGGLFSFLRPASPPESEHSNTGTQTADGRRTLWVLREGTATPILVNTGVTDGTYTEIISGEIAIGDQVIVDIGAS